MNDARLLDYLSQMRRAASDACAFVRDFDERVLKRYPEYAAKHPTIPFGKMQAMRNRIAHGYYSVDMMIVWDTVRASVPAIVEALDACL